MHYDLTGSFVGIFSLVLFVVSYYFIADEERYHLNKAKPSLFAGTAIFMVIGVFFWANGLDKTALEAAIHETIFEIACLFFFLYAAMVFIEVIAERGVFDRLKSVLVSKNMSYRQIFWSVGAIAYIMGAFAGNLTTALVLATLIYAIDKDNKPFLIATSVNIVTASNAGGVWSPFGNVTTLMAWVAGKAEFVEFLELVPASLIGWLVTAVLLMRFVPHGSPTSSSEAESKLRPGAITVIFLGVLTIACAVFANQALGLPAVWGMMFGLGLLGLFSYKLKVRNGHDIALFKTMEKIEHDTLLFFFGLMGAIGGLGFLGYLAMLAGVYEQLGHTNMNILVGLMSALLDNVPMMYAIIKANPNMSHEQWLLVTLTIGTGGSIIAIGSAAGIAIMGRLRGIYTFGSHLKMSWTVAVGYFVSIAVWYLQFEVLS